MNERPVIVTSEDAVEVFSRGDLRWNLTIADLVFIGEYTTNAGPHADDYFLEFITVQKGLASWFEVTFYADGRDDAIAALGRKLGQPLSFELFHSTDFKSRIMWPPELEGKPYRTLVPYKDAGDRLIRALKFQGRDYIFSSELTSYITNKCTSTSSNGTDS